MNAERGSRLGSFLLGGILGGLAGFAASHMRSRPEPPRPAGPPGLSSFEGAPCYRELIEQERRETERDGPRS